jgi:hypothetical protein
MAFAIDEQPAALFSREAVVLSVSEGNAMRMYDD